jgi:hypothetical protein
VFPTRVQFHPSFIWEQGVEPTISVEFHNGLHSGRLPALPANVRHGWKGIEVANTLAYYDTANITALKVL